CAGKSASECPNAGHSKRKTLIHWGCAGACARFPLLATPRDTVARVGADGPRYCHALWRYKAVHNTERAKILWNRSRPSSFFPRGGEDLTMSLTAAALYYQLGSLIAQTPELTDPADRQADAWIERAC